MNPIIKIIMPQLLKYAAEHKDEVIARIQAEAYKFFISIDADADGKPDIEQSFSELQIISEMVMRLFVRGQKLVAKYGTKAKP